MQLTHSFFTDSILSVKENVVKNILFRASAVCLQYATFNFCAYVAYLTMEYTSFLMFAENYVQRALFVTSRGMNRSSMIVLAFSISYMLANVYDTFLWALDSPGYVKRSAFVNGTTVTPFLQQNPSYITVISDPDHDLDSTNVNETLTSNLFKPGFNFSFPPAAYIRTPAAIMPPKPMNTSDFVGPRIYLDDEGFGVSFGQQMLSWASNGGECPTTEGGNGTLLIWYCNVLNTESNRLLRVSGGGLLVWWDNDYNKTTVVAPDRVDNPWASYSTGAGTGVMKQVFTVTKGNKRHTFLQTTLKVSMVTRGIFPDDEIRTMIRRIYAPGDNADGLKVADVFTKRCLEAQQNGLNSSTMGYMIQDKERAFIGWSSTEFFNMVNEFFPTEKDMGVLRIYDIIVELVRSETIPESVQPVVPCDKWNVNRANGGKVRWNDCYLSTTPDQADPRFLGQIDISSVALINDILGDSKNDTNAVAFNATGEDWYIFNRSWIDQLLLSRAFLVGGDASSVNLLVHHNEVAISYLQLLLILLPLVLALAAFTLMLKDKPGYYKSSLFASLTTTTHLNDQTGTCEAVRYIKHPPNLVLQRSEEHIRIGTDDGAYITSSRQLLKNDQRRDSSAAGHKAEDSVPPSPHPPA